MNKHKISTYALIGLFLVVSIGLTFASDFYGLGYENVVYGDGGQLATASLGTYYNESGTVFPIIHWMTSNATNLHLNVTGSLELEETLYIKNDCGVASFTYAAEEDAAISPADNGGLEWSFGGSLISEGITQACSGTITAMSLSCESIAVGTECVAVAINGAGDLDCDLTPTLSGNYTTCDIPFAQGDRIGFNTTQTCNTCGGCIATMWGVYD